MLVHLVSSPTLAGAVESQARATVQTKADRMVKRIAESGERYA